MNEFKEIYENILDSKIISEINKIIDRISEFSFKIIDYSVGKPIDGDDSIFMKKYKFQPSEDTLEFQCGTCWDIAVAMKTELEKTGLNPICIYYESDEKTEFPANHMFLVIELHAGFYSIEASWKNMLGIRGPYNDINEIFHRYAQEQIKGIPGIKFINFFKADILPPFYSDMKTFMKLIKNNKCIYRYRKYSDQPLIEEYEKEFSPYKLCTEQILSEFKHSNVNIGQKAIGYLLKNFKNTPNKIDHDIFKFKINRLWKFYDDYFIDCCKWNLFLFKTDFRNPGIAEREILNFDPLYDIQGLPAQMSNTYGLTFTFPQIKTYMIMMDEAYMNDTGKICHEFSHFVQLVSDRMILSEDEIPKDILEFFKLNSDLNLISYMFNPREFWVNIYNDFFNGLQKIYWKNFRHESWDSFIDEMMNSIKINITSFEDSKLFKYWNRENMSNLFYVNFMACLYHLNGEFFDEIAERLKNRR